MINLYNPDNTNYEANGDVILLPIKCECTAGINRTWQIDLEHPIDEEGRWKSIVVDAVIKCPTFYGLQLWRVVQCEKRDSGVVATCDPIFYDAAHEVVVIDRVDFENKTPKEVIDALTEGTKFSGTSDITDRNTVWYQQENLVAIITSTDRSIVHTYDAEIGFNNYEVQILDRLGGNYGASVLWGKNLAVDGISEAVNIDGTFTRIVPVAYNGYTLPEKYVDSPHINDYPFPRVAIISYDHLRLWADKTDGEEGTAKTQYFNTLEELYAAMRAEAQLEYTENELDKPSVGLEVQMVLIQNTEEYKDYADLERVSIGDEVRCYNPRLDIDVTTRVRTIVYDCVRDSVISVELGKEKRNYFDNVTSMIQAATKAITPEGTIIAEQIQGFINGAYAQLRLQNTIAKKQDVRAILFEDLDPASPTYGALAIGTQGWQISKERTTDGRDWVWTTAATAGGIIANTVVTGLLADQAGRNYWNLDTGEFSLTGYASDADVDAALAEAELYTDNTAAATLRAARTYADEQDTNTYDRATTYTDGKAADTLTAAEQYALATANSAVQALNNSLNQQEVFNRLTNNGAAQGIYLQNGNLYINGTYIAAGVIDGSLIKAGIITDQAGRNYWNMTTGEFSLTGYATQAYADGKAATAEANAKSYADTEAAAAESNAKTYADGKAATAETNAKAYADGTLQTAKDYADALQNRNLSPYLGQPFTDSSYWQTRPNAAYYTYLGNGWARFNRTNGTSSTVWHGFYPYLGSMEIEPNTKYTIMIEVKNLTYSGAAPYIRTSYTGTPNAAITSYATYRPEGDNIYYAKPTSKADLTNATVITKTMIGVAAGASATFDIRVSIYKGEYEGPFQPYILKLTQEDVFNILTDGGAMNGIYMQNGQLYINATYIRSGTISGDYINGGTIQGTTILNEEIIETTTEKETLTAKVENGKLISSYKMEVGGSVVSERSVGLDSGTMDFFSGTDLMGYINALTGITFEDPQTNEGFNLTYDSFSFKRGSTYYDIGPYIPGESDSYTLGPWSGYVTGRQITFFIPTRRSALGRTLTVTPPSTMIVRGVQGFFDSTQNIDATTDWTWTAAALDNGIRINGTRGTAFTNVVNQTPISVRGTFTVAFA